MTRAGVGITKSVSFRGVAQEFTNTYFYESAVGTMSEADGLALIDAIKALEVPLHASAVTFVRGRCWSAGGTNTQNQMIAQKTLSGTGGGGGAMSNMDRERAFLVRIRAGNDSRGRPVYLRKYWHLTVGAIDSVTIASGVLENTSQLQASQRTFLANAYNNFKTVSASGGPYVLVAESGRATTGNGECHPYLEHHQLGDMWRG